MSFFFICKLDVSYRTFFAFIICLDIIVNSALVTLSVFYLIKQFDTLLLVFTGFTVIYVFYVLRVLCLYLGDRNTASRTNKCFAWIRLLISLVSLYGIKYAIMIFQEAMFYQGAKRIVVISYSVGTLFGLFFYWLFNLYWTFILLIKITSRNVVMSEKNQNDYYQDDSRIQD